MGKSKEIVRHGGTRKKLKLRLNLKLNTYVQGNIYRELNVRRVKPTVYLIHGFFIVEFMDKSGSKVEFLIRMVYCHITKANGGILRTYTHIPMYSRYIVVHGFLPWCTMWAVKDIVISCTRNLHS